MYGELQIYNEKWGSRIMMDSTVGRGWLNDISKGELRFFISESHKPVIQIARHMRIRPEAVMQVLSDAFDESLLNRTMIVKNGCISFECDIATITLDPGAEGYHWELSYKAKEAMFNKNISAHPDDAYSIPETLYNGNVCLSFTRIHPMMRMIHGNDHSPSVGTFDVLNRHYSDAVRKGTIIQEGNALTFSSGFCSQNGNAIYVTIEPDYFNPIPNLWHITRIEEKREE